MTTTFTPYTSLQQMFDIAAAHLLKQGKKAVAHNGKSCMYRAPDGCKCAVGALIPDELYSPNLEGRSASGVIQRLGTAWIVPELRGLERTGFLLGQLQFIHDGYEPTNWREGLNRLANDNNLSTQVLG